MALTFRALALAGAFAASTALCVPAAAANVPSAPALGAPSAAFDHSRFDPVSATADWRCRGYGCGYHRGYRRNRVDAGDVLIGAAIIGGIAAIVSSNNRRERERDVVIVERDRDFRDRDTRYDDRRDDRRAEPRGSGASGLDNAVNQCLDRIERDVRVDTVENVTRTGAGWQVSGVLFNGSSFQCRIGNSGQIEGIDYGDGFAAVAPSEPYLGRAEGQWSDERYADARQALGGGAGPGGAIAPQQARAPETLAVASPSADRLPAYPGGPIPGEEIPETLEGGL